MSDLDVESGSCWNVLTQMFNRFLNLFKVLIMRLFKYFVRKTCVETLLGVKDSYEMLTSVRCKMSVDPVQVKRLDTLYHFIQANGESVSKPFGLILHMGQITPQTF